MTITIEQAEQEIKTWRSNLKNWLYAKEFFGDKFENEYGKVLMLLTKENDDQLITSFINDIKTLN